MVYLKACFTFIIVVAVFFFFITCECMLYVFILMVSKRRALDLSIFPVCDTVMSFNIKKCTTAHQTC